MIVVAPEQTALPPLPDRFEDPVGLGVGAQAVTIAAHDRTHDRAVVIKVLELSRVRDWKAFERFERECAVLQSLDHPGVPTYLEHSRDEERGQYRLVMERIEGTSLAEDLRRGRRRTEAQLLDLLTQLLDVLQYLHGLHPAVVHRDIKPGNVVVRPDGRAALVDFGGVAKVFQPEGASTVVGTFGYMAPEQLHGRVTPACDLYALGATLAALAAGEDADRLPRKGLEVDLSEAVGPGVLRSVLGAMLRADPDRRPESVAQVRARLRRLERGEESSSTATPEREVAIERAPTRTVAAEESSTSLSVTKIWGKLSVVQRRKAKIYLGVVWVMIGAGAATRAIPLLLLGVLLFLALPFVLGTLHGLGDDDRR